MHACMHPDKQSRFKPSFCDEWTNLRPDTPPLIHAGFKSEISSTLVVMFLFKRVSWPAKGQSITLDKNLFKSFLSEQFGQFFSTLSDSLFEFKFKSQKLLLNGFILQLDISFFLSLYFYSLLFAGLIHFE